MADQLIIGVVVTIALGAHYWLYLWIKFRIDEGVILAFLEDPTKNTGDSFCSIQVIASDTDIALKRVSVVCNKSNKIQRTAQAGDSWDVIS